MFGPKKNKISKKDLKKSIVKTNDRLQSINTSLEVKIKEGEGRLKALEDERKASEKASVAIQEEMKSIIEEVNSEKVKLLDIKQESIKYADNLSDIHLSITEANNSLVDLTKKETSLKRSVDLLVKQKADHTNLKESIKDLKSIKEELNDRIQVLLSGTDQLQAELLGYVDKKEALDNEFNDLKNELDKKKVKAENELKELEGFIERMKFANGRQMAKLDEAIAERMTDLDDLGNMIKKKEYDYVAAESKVQEASLRAKDAGEMADYSTKKEQDKVNEIKKGFKEWKISALDEVAKLKLRKKIDNIDKAGLKDVLDG